MIRWRSRRGRGSAVAPALGNDRIRIEHETARYIFHVAPSWSRAEEIVAVIVARFIAGVPCLGRQPDPETDGRLHIGWPLPISGSLEQICAEARAAGFIVRSEEEFTARPMLWTRDRLSNLYVTWAENGSDGTVEIRVPMADLVPPDILAAAYELARI